MGRISTLALTWVPIPARLALGRLGLTCQLSSGLTEIPEGLLLQGPVAGDLASRAPAVTALPGMAQFTNDLSSLKSGPSASFRAFPAALVGY